MIDDICRFVGMEKQSLLVEDVLSVLVCRSILSGMEGKCLNLLQKLEWRWFEHAWSRVYCGKWNQFSGKQSISGYVQNNLHVRYHAI